MTLPPNIQARLLSGRAVASAISSPSSEARAYLVLLPQVPDQHIYQERWLHSGTGEPWLRNTNDITGYEIRYLQHHAKYTNSAWGYDYDQVLNDFTTRVKRMFVMTLDDICEVIKPLAADNPNFQHPHQFNSSLVNSPINGYLERPDEYPHLWQP